MDFNQPQDLMIIKINKIINSLQFNFKVKNLYSNNKMDFRLKEIRKMIIAWMYYWKYQILNLSLWKIFHLKKIFWFLTIIMIIIILFKNLKKESVWIIKIKLLIYKQKIITFNQILIIIIRM